MENWKEGEGGRAVLTVGDMSRKPEQGRTAIPVLVQKSGRKWKKCGHTTKESGPIEQRTEGEKTWGGARSSIEVPSHDSKKGIHRGGKVP